MSTGSDENSMKRSSRGRRPQYTWLVVFCLGEIYINEVRKLNKERESVGFTQTDIHDCVNELIGIKNPDIIRNAIYDAESHGWIAAIKVHRHGRDLFVPTKSGLALHTVINEVLFSTDLLALYLTSPGKVGEEIKHVLTRLRLILDSLISQFNLYEILTRHGSSSFEYQRISRRLNLLNEIRDAIIGYNKEIPTSIEVRRLYNMIRYLLELLKMMKVSGIGALCNAVDRITNEPDPLVWNENVLG